MNANILENGIAKSFQSVTGSKPEQDLVTVSKVGQLCGEVAKDTIVGKASCADLTRLEIALRIPPATWARTP